MNQRPRLLTEPILDKLVFTGLIIQNTILTIHHLGTYLLGLYWYTNWDGTNTGDQYQSEGLELARSMVFLGIVFSENLRTFTCRSLRTSIFSLGFWSNRYVPWSVVICTALALFVNGVPGLNRVFHLTLVTEFRAWAFILGTAIFPAVIDELTKLVYRRTGYAVRPSVVLPQSREASTEVSKVEASANSLPQVLPLQHESEMSFRPRSEQSVLNIPRAISPEVFEITIE